MEVGTSHLQNSETCKNFPVKLDLNDVGHELPSTEQTQENSHGET